MLYTEGMLTAEDHTLRKIARSTVNCALRSIETKTDRILDALIGKLASQTENFSTLDLMLESVLAHPLLAAETATIERYVKAFPEFNEMVEDARTRIKTRARTRLERAIAPFSFQRRFRFTRVRHCH